MEENLRLKYDSVFEMQGESCLVPSSWGHEEG
ncbi:hypothetical protein SAMN06298215_0708 [Bacteroidales bacterium WCE2008]|nr:hypothetical protein SAMN06298215_0708 [Bacteroidales bacterium WCE2008]